MISIKTMKRLSLTTKFLPPPPPGCYTYTQTLYGWSQSWAIKHRNRFPIWCKSRIQTLNSHTFITKISKHRTTYTDSNANFIENSIAEREERTQTEKTKCFYRRPHYPRRAYTSINIRRAADPRIGHRFQGHVTYSTT